MKMKVTVALLVGLAHLTSLASDSSNPLQDNVEKFRKAVANNNARLALGYFQNIQTLNQEKASEIALLTPGFTKLIKQSDKETKSKFTQMNAQAKNTKTAALLNKVVTTTSSKTDLKKTLNKFKKDHQSSNPRMIKVKTLDGNTFILPPESYEHFEMLAGCVEGTNYYQHVDRPTIPLDNISAPCLEFLLNIVPLHENDEKIEEKLKSIDLQTKEGKDLLTELVYASDYLLAPRSVANAIAKHARYNRLLDQDTFAHDGIRIICKLEQDLNKKGKITRPILSSYGDVAYAEHLMCILPKRDALVLAARHKRIDIVKECIKEKVDINAGMTNSKSTTALRQSVVNCNVEIAELLLNHGTKIQKRLIESCWLQHINGLEKAELENELKSRGKILYLLVKAGASLEEKNYDEATPLITACQYYGPEQALMLLEKGAQVNVQDKYGLTPLYFACKRGNATLVKELIAKGADISNSKDVLANACENKNAEVAIYLVNEQKLKPSERHLRLAIKHKNIKLAELLLKQGCTYTQEKLSTDLYEALKNKQKESVDFLMKQGASIYQAGEYGYTPLTRACNDLDVDMVKLCMTHKANLNQRDAQGRLALTEALVDRHKELQNSKKIAKIVHLLLASGADPNKECTSKHRRPLDLAISNAPELVTTLLKHGADPNYACTGTNYFSQEESCLEYAIRLLSSNGWEDYIPNTLIPLIRKIENKEHVHQAMSYLIRNFSPARLETPTASNIIKELVLAGTDLNKTDTDGNTLLLQLMQKTFNNGSWSQETTKLIDLFIKHGTDINHKNNKGESALSIALSFHKKYIYRTREAFITKENYQAVEHLIKLGARVDGRVGELWDEIEGTGANKKINQLLRKTLHKQYPEAAARQQANIVKEKNENADQSQDNDNNDQGWCTIA